MIDYYFRRPIFWDLFISILATVITYILVLKSIITISEEKYYMQISSDLSTISLTSAGFILTLLTVLITFKSNSKVSRTNYSEANTTFELFFASDLYNETIVHLKNCVKILISVAIAGYLLKMLLKSSCYGNLFFYNIFSLSIIVLTLWRCLLILSNIFKMQKE